MPPVVRCWLSEREPIHPFSSQANRLEIATELFGSDRPRQHDIGPRLPQGGCQGQCVDGSTARDSFRLEASEVFAFGSVGKATVGERFLDDDAPSLRLCVC